MKQNTAPYNFIRRGIFALIYPARFMHVPTAKEREDHSLLPEIEPYYNFKSKINLNKAVKESKHPFSMDIDCCMLSKNGTKAYDLDKQYIIHCDGNASCYEKRLDALDHWCNEKRNLVLFDPPGVRFSPGHTYGPEDYMRALKCMIEYLHAQGIPYENMVLSGHSLGAAISTMVGNDYHQQNHRIPVINVRSFGSMASAAAAYVKNSIPTTILRATIGNLLYGLVYGLVNITGLNFNPSKAFIEINNKHPGDAICLMVEGDRIVPQAQSLYQTLSEDMRAKYASVYKKDAKDEEEPHNYPLQLLVGTKSKITAEEQVLENFDAHLPMPGLQKKEMQIKALFSEVVTIVEKVKKTQNKSSMLSLSKHEHAKLIADLKTSVSALNVSRQQLSNMDKLIDSSDPKALQLAEMSMELLAISQLVNAFIQKIISELAETSPKPNKSVVFSNKRDTATFPKQLLNEIDQEDIIRQFESFNKKFLKK